MINRIQYRQGAIHKVPDMLSCPQISAVQPVALDNIDPNVLRQEQLKDKVWSDVIEYLVPSICHMKSSRLI